MNAASGRHTNYPITPAGALVPAGGIVNEALIKKSGIDYDYGWSAESLVPPGGIIGAALIKNSVTDFDFGWSAEPITRSDPLLADLPADVTFPNNTAWVTVLTATTFPLPPRPANTLLQVGVNLHLVWSAVNNSQGLLDLSIDGGTHFQRYFLMLVNKADDSSVNDVTMVFFEKVAGLSPSISVVARLYTGPLGLTIVGANNPTWPNLLSQVGIFDMGPVA
jgi:hypothetical protein